jgi:hypothetical protein
MDPSFLLPVMAWNFGSPSCMSTAWSVMVHSSPSSKFSSPSSSLSMFSSFLAGGGGSLTGCLFFVGAACTLLLDFAFSGFLASTFVEDVP